MDKKIAKLRSEVANLLNQIDEEGLLFLKQQASMLIYNATVEEMNRSNRESLLDHHGAKEAEKRETKSKKSQKKVKENKIYIDMAGEDRGYGNIVYGNVRVFFTLEELGNMIYIAEKASVSGDAPLLLYRWLKKERGDFLVDNGIKSYPSPIIDLLTKYLLKPQKK